MRRSRITPRLTPLGILLLTLGLVIPQGLVASAAQQRARRGKIQKPKPGRSRAARKDAKAEIPAQQSVRTRREERADREAEDDRVELEYLARRTYGGRPIPPGAYDRAARQWKKIPPGLSRRAPRGKEADAAEVSALAVSSLGGTVWKPIGPSPLNRTNVLSNGRTTSIALNPNNPNVIYQGTVGGGLWRTTNGGTNWTPLFDQQVSLGVGDAKAVAIDPNNTDTLYVGTSSNCCSFLNGQQNRISKGVLKSTDGGGSWIVLGSDYPLANTGNADALFSGTNVNIIIVEPSNSNILYLAADNGLYRSTDGGRNWALGAGGVGGRAQSLVLDTTTPANARRLYAGINGSGIWQSVDGGVNWTQILNTATAAVANALAAVMPAGTGIGKVVVTLAPPTNPANANGVQVLYSTIEGTGGFFGTAAGGVPLGIFQSVDQGVNWNRRNATGLGGCQCFFTMEMGVDPASPGDGAADILYWGGTNAFRSNDAGTNFAAVGSLHVDTQSEWVFIRQPAPAQSTVLTGNDGGIWRSTDGGATWTGGQAGPPATINAGGLQTALFYNMDVRRDGTASVTEGSLQDNGHVRTTGPAEWTDTTGGDGFDLRFDYQNQNRAYQSNGFFNNPCTQIFRSDDSGATWPTRIDNNGIPPGELGCGIAPIATDPSAANRLYVGGLTSSLFQSSDAGANWRNVGNLGGGVIDIDVAPANSNNVVASANGTRVWVSTNALAANVPPSMTQPVVAFTDITRNLPARFVARVAFDPNDPTVIYAVLSGFNNQTPGAPGHVFRTTVGGTAWTNISPPLDIPFNAIALDGGSVPTTIYAGTDIGVMRSVDGGASWTTLDDVHLPNVPVTDLALNAQAGVLRAATFGRGAFELAAPSGPVISINAEDGLDFSSCQGGSANLTLQVFNVGTQALTVNSVQRVLGSTDFTVLPNPATPVNVAPGEEIDFTVRYTPTTSNAQQATIRVTSNDPNAPFFDLTATGAGGAPDIDVVIADGGNFGDVCVGAFEDMNLTINNSGTCDLSIGNITSNSGQFVVPGVATYPLVVEAGNSVAVPVRFQPTAPGGLKTGVISIASNDPDAPTRTVSVGGNATQPDIRVTGSTDFGQVCAGVLAEKTVSVCNVSSCPLENVTAAFVPPTADFTLVNNPFAAATTLSPSACGDIVIRFTPTSVGPKTANLRITSNDPDQPVINLTVTGTIPLPMVSVGPDFSFPATVLQSVGACDSRKPYLITNTGSCPLTITNVAVGGADAADFSLVGLPTLPTFIAPGHSVGEGDLRVRFAPLGQTPDRDRLGALAITYVSDPILYATNPATGLTTIVPNTAMCGEAVRTGARVLVTGADDNFVEKLQLQRITGNRNRPIVDSIDNAMNLPLTQVTPSGPCPPFSYHREYGTIANPIQLLPGSYRVTATALVNGKRKTKTVAFDVTTCDFNPTIIVQLP